ncbi:MAG TPA: hypothetical protein VGD63_01365 [Steroidobacteraceae bacterium]
MKVQRQKAASLLLLDLSVPTPPTNAGPPPQSDTKTYDPVKVPSPANRAKVDSATTRDPAAVTSPDASPSLPGIDWYQQGQQVASSQAESIFKELEHFCDAAALHGEHRPECRKYEKPDPWVPEPNKFGIAGGLPYVRLGKRCILGLGFFGCGVGKLPEANGHVLDDMRDADRPRSSVPDPNQ